MRPSLFSSWQMLGQMPPRQLVGARLQVHHAAQVPASVGYTYARPAADFGHTSFECQAESGVFRLVSRPGPGGYRAGIRVADMTLEVMDEAGDFVDRLHLHGRTRDEAYAWLADALRTHAGASRSLIRPDHPLPDHPVVSGAPFVYGDSLVFDALERWFIDAEALLVHLRDQHAPESPLRCWPHHFDLAFGILLDPDAGTEEARRIGVGMSPGDASYDQPYFYVTMWPPQPVESLPRLSAGQWHTQGWLGVVLTGERLVAAGSTAAQVDLALHFVESAIEACLRLLPEDG